MYIKTKYNIKDTVVFNAFGKASLPVTGVIKSISAFTDGSFTKIEYTVVIDGTDWCASEEACKLHNK